jgi:hypothetical protein
VLGVGFTDAQHRLLLTDKKISNGKEMAYLRHKCRRNHIKRDIFPAIGFKR